MNSNFNQQFNYQFDYQANDSSFSNQFSDFEFKEPCSVAAPSFLSRNNQSSFSNSTHSPPSFFESSNQQSFNSFSNSYSSTSKQSISQSNYNQYDNFGNTMGENLFIQSSNAMTPTSQFDISDQTFGESSYKDDQQDQFSLQDEEEEEEDDHVQNYGPRNSEMYKEKRYRNNLAVRKARAKFTQKNKAAIERVNILRQENIRLQHEKEIVEGRFNEVKDIYDGLFK